MKIMSTIIALIIASPLAAGVPLYPPTKYDHTYAGKHIIKIVPSHKVRKICQTRFSKPIRPDVEGCSWFTEDKTCINIISAHPRRAPNKEALMRHERAHCNGWKH